MKKVWEQPTLIILSVSETEAATKKGNNPDGAWQNKNKPKYS